MEFISLIERLQSSAPASSVGEKRVFSSKWNILAAHRDPAIIPPPKYLSPRLVMASPTYPMWESPMRTAFAVWSKPVLRLQVSRMASSHTTSSPDVVGLSVPSANVNVLGCVSFCRKRSIAEKKWPITKLTPKFDTVLRLLSKKMERNGDEVISSYDGK